MADATIPPRSDARQVLTSETPETRPKMAKAPLRNAELDAWRLRVGQAIERVQKRSEWSLKEFAAAIGRDERQVARWFTGTEHAQLAAIVAVPKLHRLLIVALAELAEESIEITTAITIRRIA